MAAINYNDYGAPAHGGTLATALNWAGALLSILLIAGLATWGWKLWVRDVAGVPVVRALEGPMRIAPAEPGGLASNYQGLTVNRIAEERVDEAPSERLVLAPEPAGLDADEDLPMAALPIVEETDDNAAFGTAEITAAPQIEDALPVADTEIAALDDASVEALVPVLPDTGNSEAVLPDEKALSATDLAVQLALGGGESLRPEPPEVKIVAAAHVPVRTPRPLIRPANLRVVAAPAIDPVNGEIDPSTIPAGTRLVQLGAYADPQVARVEWANRLAMFGDYMVGKERIVQEAETGGRSFYRLRAMGFTDLADARRFCAVLVADGANCIPVVHE